MGRFALTRFHVSGYRSIKSISVPLDEMNVLIGKNGVGKTNFYNAIKLLYAAATNTISELVMAEGGMESVLFSGASGGAGAARRITLKAVLSDAGEPDMTCIYEITIGLTAQQNGQALGASFLFEPEVKAERLVHLHRGREYCLLERKGPLVSMTGIEQGVSSTEYDLLPSETALSQIRSPRDHYLAYAVRETLCNWRFYHEFRADKQSPLRQPCLAVTSPILSSDGANLAAVFATLAHTRGDTADLDQAISGAFPGAQIDIPVPGHTATFGMRYREHPKRLFSPVELSDGTIRFLALVAALLSYRTPPFLALNEPETSLHPDLYGALAAVIAKAARRTQIVVVTHSHQLADLLTEYAASPKREFVQKSGITSIDGLGLVGYLDD
ncbi:AAA family ATPase [Trinickia fusca]|uniref:DUF2813 domain-containing protein n=1 Tax=Trinickia fusca TaxID=2419777 RepID=A0A494X5G8_9BURK|nr:AAA family ATPase [Trinickia fusca]RKP43476.1 DUF2813 domain-containing protein [Trinickia fusca]